MFSVGEKVKANWDVLDPGWAGVFVRHGVSLDSIGTVIKNDEEMYPYLVEFRTNDPWYFLEDELLPYERPSEEEMMKELM